MLFTIHIPQPRSQCQPDAPQVKVNVESTYYSVLPGMRCSVCRMSKSVKWRMTKHVPCQWNRMGDHIQCTDDPTWTRQTYSPSTRKPSMQHQDYLGKTTTSPSLPKNARAVFVPSACGVDSAKPNWTARQFLPIHTSTWVRFYIV